MEKEIKPIEMSEVRKVIYYLLLGLLIIASALFMIFISVVGFNLEGRIVNYLAVAAIFAAWGCKGDLRKLVAKFSWAELIETIFDYASILLGGTLACMFGGLNSLLVLILAIVIGAAFYVLFKLIFNKIFKSKK